MRETLEIIKHYKADISSEAAERIASNYVFEGDMTVIGDKFTFENIETKQTYNMFGSVKEHKLVDLSYCGNPVSIMVSVTLELMTNFFANDLVEEDFFALYDAKKLSLIDDNVVIYVDEEESSDISYFDAEVEC